MKYKSQNYKECIKVNQLEQCIEPETFSITIAKPEGYNAWVSKIQYGSFHQCTRLVCIKLKIKKHIKII